jgi:radical SAM protein
VQEFDSYPVGPPRLNGETNQPTWLAFGAPRSAVSAAGCRRAGVYADRPLLVYRELTRACELACRHCRAEAQSGRDPRELTTQEEISLLARLKRFGEPLPRIVLTGGDPLERDDLFDLIAVARQMGFNVAITPSGTPSLREPVIRRLKESGIETIALSLDGSNAQRHDGIRGVDGSYELTVRAARQVADLGIPLQINTLVCAETLDDLPHISKLVENLGAIRWSLFFLIGVGRGAALQQISPQQCERLMDWLCDIAPLALFDIKTTEAPHYRRVQLQHRARDRRAGATGDVPASVRRGFGIRDGNGIMFISHIGEIYPSGFLPIVAGDVRRDDPVEVYRHHPLFMSLRDADRLVGKCGRCEFRWICGGSRARAFAATGDPMESDLLCAYEPETAVVK